MNRLEAKLKEIATNRSAGPAIMAHVVLGYPTLEESIELVLQMEKVGVSIVELQLPFTDPMADGPVIMEASDVALANGVRTKQCMEAMAELSQKCSIPLLFMTYYNLAYCYSKGGLEGFCRDAAAAGAQGLIVPDVSPEESDDGYWKYCHQYGLAAIPLVSPLSSKDRLERIRDKASSGFVYCVSTLGTTGTSVDIDSETKDYFCRVKEMFNLPIAVGFGISSVGQVRQLSGVADIAIVGSATIREMKKASNKEKVSAALRFLSELSSVAS